MRERLLALEHPELPDRDRVLASSGREGHIHAPRSRGAERRRGCEDPGPGRRVHEDFLGGPAGPVELERQTAFADGLPPLEPGEMDGPRIARFSGHVRWVFHEKLQGVRPDRDDVAARVSMVLLGRLGVLAGSAGREGNRRENHEPAPGLFVMRFLSIPSIRHRSFSGARPMARSRSK